MIIIEIATGMIVTQIETAMGAMIGIGTGIGEIVIAAIGTEIDNSSTNGKSRKTFGVCFEDNIHIEPQRRTALALGLGERQPHHLRRILSAHRIELVLT